MLAALIDLDEGVRVLSNLVDVDPSRHHDRHARDRRLPADAPRRRSPGLQAQGDRPMDSRLRDATAIVGMGQTEFSKAAGRSETQLAAEAIVAALADAGLTTADVDGLVSYTIDPVEETELVRTLGIPEIRFSSRVPYGGGGSQGVLLHAAAAVAAGVADVVVVYRAIKARSGERFGRAAVGGRATSSHSGSTAMQWCTPYGVLTPASWMSLNSVRYMHTYGVSSEDFGRAVVQFRDYAANNPNAHFYKKPITLDEHQASRWIAEPAIRLFDCCQETDGSVALVITSAERALGSDRPVLIGAAANAALFEEEIASNHYTKDIAVMEGCAAMAEHLFEGYGFQTIRHRRRDDLRRVLPDVSHATRGSRILRPRGGQGLHRGRQPGTAGQSSLQHQRGLDR